MSTGSQIAEHVPERIKVLDVIRGFALLGIFLMNIEYFNRPFQEFGLGISATTLGWDYIVARLTEIFVTGKFWVLFSLLFGMGFVAMQTQAALDDRPFKSLYLRRTAALLVFGLLHVSFLWSGDILHSYAFVAFALMWLPFISARASCWIGASLYIAPAFLLLLSGLIMGLIPDEEINKIAVEAGENNQAAIQAAKIYAEGDYFAVVGQRWRDFLHTLSFEPYVFIGAYGIFLVGAGIMRSGYLLDLQANRRFFLKAMLIFGVLAAVLLGIAGLYHGHVVITPKGMLEQALMMMGNLPLSLFYLFAIAYSMSFVSGGKILGVLAPAGKMALTNYLMQSLIASLVFYGYGLGFWQQWGRVQLALFVVSVFIGQVIFSHLWLGYFRYGPMEWLWRALTYWTWPPMRR